MCSDERYKVRGTFPDIQMGFLVNCYICQKNIPSDSEPRVVWNGKCSTCMDVQPQVSLSSTLFNLH